MNRLSGTDLSVRYEWLNCHVPLAVFFQIKLTHLRHSWLVMQYLTKYFLSRGLVLKVHFLYTQPLCWSHKVFLLLTVKKISDFYYNMAEQRLWLVTSIDTWKDIFNNKGCFRCWLFTNGYSLVMQNIILGFFIVIDSAVIRFEFFWSRISNVVKQ